MSDVAMVLPPSSQPGTTTSQLLSNGPTSVVNDSCDVTGAAILDGFVGISERDIDPVDFNQGSDLPCDQGTFLFTIAIYSGCSMGTCNCVHFIGDSPCQLKPCRVAGFLFGHSALPTITESDREFLWNGLVNGFDIVDAECPSSYMCQNYDSITSAPAYEEMSKLLTTELESHKVILSDDQPTCVHSLEAVWKTNGKLRPITDCSRPDGACINNYMQTTFSPFRITQWTRQFKFFSPRTTWLLSISLQPIVRSV